MRGRVRSSSIISELNSNVIHGWIFVFREDGPTSALIFRGKVSPVAINSPNRFVVNCAHQNGPRLCHT